MSTSAHDKLVEESRAQLAELAAKETHPAHRLLDELDWSDPKNAERIAKKFIEVDGDVSEYFMHLLETYDLKLAEHVQQMRVAHFAKHGKPVPKYTGKYPR